MNNYTSANLPNAYLPTSTQRPLTEDLTYEKAFANFTNGNRFFTTSAATTPPHNTILITNNFAQQTLPNNMRLLTTTANTYGLNGLDKNVDTSTQLYTAPTAAHFALLPHLTQPLTMYSNANSAQYFINAEQNDTTKLSTPPTSTNNSTSSPMVLDRINICINNHYSDGTTGLNSTENHIPAPASPIIPAIQHKPALLPNTIPVDACDIQVLRIDEPDSTTTTPHTPPATPELNQSQIIDLNSPVQQSPTTTTDNQLDLKILEATIEEDISKECAYESNEDEKEEVVEVEKPKEDDTSMNGLFHIGEDVLLKRKDNRFYLGTIIEQTHEQYLLRFDDKSEQWCTSSEIRKMGGCETKSGNSPAVCVACKRNQPDNVVECCERCGRGYHRNCTKELIPGSGNWLCKR